MPRRAQLHELLALLGSALLTASCIGGPPPSGLTLVVENRSREGAEILWPDVTGSSQADRAAPCERVVRGITPGRHSIEIVTASDRRSLALDVEKAEGAVPERWVVIDAGGRITADAPPGSLASPVCASEPASSP